MCVDPYLLPEHQSCGQDAQGTQEADEAKEQELLGGLWGLPVACVWEGREAEGLVTLHPTNPQAPNPYVSFTRDPLTPLPYKDAQALLPRSSFPHSLWLGLNLCLFLYSH